MDKTVTITRTITLQVNEENKTIMEEWLDERLDRTKSDAEDFEEELPEGKGRVIYVVWDDDLVQDTIDQENFDELPDEVRVPDYIKDEDIPDWLYDNYDFHPNEWGYVK